MAVKELAMRVPPEILLVILECAEQLFTLKEWFELRLLNKYINEQILKTAFLSTRFHRTFRYQCNAWRHCPSSLQRIYLRQCVTYHLKEPCIFSTLFYRSIEEQITDTAEEHDEKTRSKLINDTLDNFDLAILGPQFTDNFWRPFAQGRSMHHWLSGIDDWFTAHADIQDYMRVYLLYRELEGYKCFTRFTYRRIIALFTKPAPATFSPFLADEVINYILERTSSTSVLAAILRSQLGPILLEIPLAAHVLTSAEKDNFDITLNFLLHAMNGAYFGLTAKHEVLNVFVEAIRTLCFQVGKHDLAHYIVARLTDGTGLRGLHALFRDVWEEDFVSEDPHFSYALHFHRRRRGENKYVMDRGREEKVRELMRLEEEEDRRRTMGLVVS